VRLIGANVDPPVWDCPAFGATTICTGDWYCSFPHELSLYRLVTNGVAERPAPFLYSGSKHNSISTNTEKNHHGNCEVGPA